MLQDKLRNGPDPEEARQRARENKDRAKRMERRITKRFNGIMQRSAIRTPFSGAGYLKGDNIIELPVGKLIIECKLSAKRIGDIAYVPFFCNWIPKLQSDTDALYSIGARASMFVLHWHRRGDDLDICIVSQKDAQELQRQLHIPFDTFVQTTELQTRKKNLKPLKRVDIPQTITRNTWLYLNESIFYILPLEDMYNYYESAYR